MAELLEQVTPPQFHHVFFSGSGSEGNDTVVRMVRRYWDLLGQPQRQVIISRENAYHGSTMAGASLGGMSGMHAQGGLPIPGIVHIGQPYWWEHGRSMSRDEFGLVAARWLEDKILELGADKVAAFIGEPIQGAGGVIIPPQNYWPEIQKICKKYDILLIADEVICGFGRTGYWFASEFYGIEADFMTLAKGITSGYIPLSAIMVSAKVAEVLTGMGDFAHGFTYSGHPVACAVAIENIRIMRDEKLVERVHSETGPYLTTKMQEFLDHPLVGEVRNLGLMGAIELVKDKKTRQTFEPVGETGTICRDHCFKLGLVMRATRDTMLISPPLTWTKADIDEWAGLARQALDLTAKDLGVS